MNYSMPKKSQQGFTLIELLVVIAIIGILAAMVITNLRTARSKARDASAITSMSSARAEAENYYDEQGLSYGNLCQSSSYNGTTGTVNNFEVLMNAAASANGQSVVCQVDQSSNNQRYYAYAILSATSDFFCIDSSGFAGKVATVPQGSECNQ